MKIVVPVDEDKQTVFKRTGRAPFFALYENEILQKCIVNSHAASHHGDKGEHEGGHEHDEEHHHEEHSAEEVQHHRQDIGELIGCDVILAQAVGENMKEALESIGLKIQKISKSDGTTAQEVVNKFITNSLKRQNKKGQIMEESKQNKQTRLVFPTDEDMGYLSKRGAHFGKAKFYTIVTLEGEAIKDVEVVANPGHSGGACGNAVLNIMSLKPDGLVVSGIGGSPAEGFAKAGLDLYFDSTSATVELSIKAFLSGKLEKSSGQGTCSAH